MYKINDIPLSSFGITPAPFSGQSLAVRGVFDFPSRKGDTEYNWGTETEPFVSTPDIRYNPREIYFNGLMKATSRENLLQYLNGFVSLCKSGELHLETPVGLFPIFLTGSISVDEKDSLALSIEAKFNQLEYSFPLILGNPVGGNGYQLAGYNLKLYFGILVNTSLNRFTTPDRIEVSTTDIYKEALYRMPLNITLTCIMVAPTLADLTTKMNLFHGLLSLQGLKTLKFPDGENYEVYLKDGFKVNNIIVGSKSIAQFSIEFRKP